MGRQIRFAIDSVDAQCFLEDAQATRGTVLVAWKSFTPEPVIAQRFDVPVGGWFLCRQEDLALIRPRFIEQQHYWVVDVSYMPLVQWSTVPEEDDVIGETRLYFIAAGQSVEFVKFGESLFRLMKKYAPVVQVINGYRVRFGVSAAKRIAAGELTFWGCGVRMRGDSRESV